MSLVSAVAHTLMDKCEAERKQVTQVAVKALGEALLKCCTKGSAGTLVRTVEESNGAEALRPMHSRYAPDTQNPQYAMMQKIMMLAKL